MILFVKIEMISNFVVLLTTALFFFEIQFPCFTKDFIIFVRETAKDPAKTKEEGLLTR